jgi:3-amino-4-hydroxybenzoic acid synthase
MTSSLTNENGESVKFAWVDVRETPAIILDAVVQEAVHARVSAIISDDPGLIESLPPTVRRVLGVPRGAALDDYEKTADVLLIPIATGAELDQVAAQRTAFQCELAVAVEVSDQFTLDLACDAARRMPNTVLKFTDPTKIPLEIVIAAADKSPGELITYGVDMEELQILVGVLEKGTDGVAFAPHAVGQVGEVMSMLSISSPKLEMEELRIVSVLHSGLGDRVCVDT